MSGKVVGGALLAVVLLGGCAGGVDGYWQSRDELSNGKRNLLELVDDATGSLLLYARLEQGGALTKLLYEIGWEEDEWGDYYLEADCTKGCGDRKLDFTMVCVHDPDAQTLDCDAKKPFSGYGFFEFEPEPLE